MPDAPPYRQVGIVGTGRVARAMGLALADRSAGPLLLWGRHPAHCSAAITAIGQGRCAPSLADIAATCDLLVFAIADDAMDQRVEEMAAVDRADAPLVFHVSGRSGASTLAPLRAKGWLTAAIHPAMTFTGDPEEEIGRMIGARFAVTGSNDQARAAALAVVRRLGGAPVEIVEEHRPLYHAALCHGANHLVTLIAGSFEALSAAGVDDPAALLGPLVRAALENSLADGLAGLSGPLLRGDGETIIRHLAALRQLCPTLLLPYRAMAIATLDALERRGGTASLSTCRSALEEDC